MDCAEAMRGFRVSKLMRLAGKYLYRLVGYKKRDLLGGRDQLARKLRESPRPLHARLSSAKPLLVRERTWLFRQDDHLLLYM